MRWLSVVRVKRPYNAFGGCIDNTICMTPDSTRREYTKLCFDNGSVPFDTHCRKSAHI